ncbi:MAG TPA: hypothetical protein G4O10_01765 [Dehalococcoidia bacterium]|nr:hypothetical protein [Dehalococcoidia bacterium]
MAQTIEAIKKQVTELKEMSGEVQAIDRNVERMLASIRVLEINVSDLADII